MGLKKNTRNCTQDYVDVIDIQDGFIFTNDNRIIKIVEICPINYAMKSPTEQEAIMAGWRKWLRECPTRFTIKCTTRQTPTDQYTNAFQDKRAKEKSQKVIDRIDDHCRFVSSLGSGQSIEHKFYLIIEYERTEFDTSDTLEEKLQLFREQVLTVISGLQLLGNTILRQENPTKEVCEFLYNHYNRALIRGESFEDRLKRYDHDVQYINNAYGDDNFKNIYIKDILAPISMNTSESPDYMLIDGMYYSYYYIKANEYPNHMDTFGWLAGLINLKYGIEVDLFFEKKELDETLKKMRRKTRLTRLKLKDRSSTAADYEEVEGSYAALNYARNRIKECGDEPFDMYILITVCAYTIRDLLQKKKDLTRYAQREEFGLGQFRYTQEDGFLSTAPLNKLTKRAAQRSRHNILTEVITAAYPFTTFALNDENGILIGQHLNNRSLVIYDPFDSRKYANANMTIFGGSGRGKTFTLLTVTTRLRYKGVRSFILSPDKQDEFRRTCTEIDGEFVDVSTSANTRLNPFDIWPITSEADMIINDKTGNETSWLINKITALDRWVNMMVEGLNQEDRARIKNCIYQMYNKKGITENNDSLYKDIITKEMKDMPTYSDFVEELKNDPLVPKQAITVYEQFVTGIYKNLNGPTNVDLDNKYIVFGMEHLSGELQAAMMFIILDFIWSVAKSDKTENKAIVIDEGSLLVNGKDEQVGDFVVEIFRMIRGYGGSAIFATQTIADLYKNGGEFGNVIQSCAHSHILMGMESSDVDLIKDALGLSDNEATEVSSFSVEQKGMALLCAGAIHIPISVRASETEKMMFDTSSQGLRKLKELREKQKVQNESF